MNSSVESGGRPSIVMYPNRPETTLAIFDKTSARKGLVVLT
jgi:hypothetical protein